jgi:signal transduction histidine kinase
MGTDDEGFTLKKALFSKLNRKLTLLFMIVALVAPALGISYFYLISISVVPESLVAEQAVLLETTVVIVITLIAVDAGVIGFLVSRSISKPIKELYKATQVVEKGNFTVRTDIETGDEIEELGRAFNKTTEALSRMDAERKEIDNAKTEFLSITSHELRSPMTPMRAQLQMLVNEYFGKLTKEQKDSLDIVIRNADRLDTIIVDFLEISRIEAARLKFEFRATDIGKVVRDVVEFMKGFASEKNIKLISDTENLPMIEIDPDRVSQVLRNLINNAVKFSDENSKVEILAKQKNNHILFSVKDYGCGLSSENCIRVFEPFYQVEESSSRKHGGTGLGLAICRGIVESQKGKIWVESILGEGSTFYFTSPLEPVKEIEPIKVLFSQKDTIERKLKEHFNTILGPLGSVEFNELKGKNALWKDDILEYIDTLTDQYILTEKQSDDFKNRIRGVFGEEREVINEEENTLYDSFEQEVTT